MSETKRADQRKYHYVYKTVCLITGRFYYGMHSTDKLDDGYLGSGKRLWHSIDAHGKENHKTEILEFLPDRRSLAAREAEIVTQEMLNDEMCMNIRLGGIGVNPLGFDMPEGGRAKISASSKKRWKPVNEAKQIEIEEFAKDFTMARAEILKELVSESGRLSGNAVRALKKFQGVNKIKSMQWREVNVQVKWMYILKKLKNENFPNASITELINAYVLELQEKPTCICGKHTTFFRFKQPYAKYCGNKCQLLDPNFKNPVYSRWHKEAGSSEPFVVSLALNK